MLTPTMSFAKLSSSIVTSTIWVQDHITIRVFIAMLATADSEGQVAGSIPGFASLCRVKIDELEKSLAILCAPDTYSRSSEFEGRRIEIIPGGWRIINYAKYRDGRDDETRRQQNAAAQRRHRSKLKCGCNHTADSKATADSKQAKADSKACKPESAHADADADADSKPPIVPQGGQAKTPLQLRIESWFNRRPKTPWTASDSRAWAKNRLSVESASEEELALLESHYNGTIPDQYKRHQLAQLVNNWTGELDRIRQNGSPRPFKDPYRIADAHLTAQ